MAPCLGPNFNMNFDGEVWLSNVSVAPGHTTNFVIDMEKRTCQHSVMDKASVEFPTTHPYRQGMAGTRYNYLMGNDRPGQNLPYRDVIKVFPAYVYLIVLLNILKQAFGILLKLISRELVLGGCEVGFQDSHRQFRVIPRLTTK